jgi:hypothetical protein
VTVTSIEDRETGEVRYTAEITIQGVAPSRGTTAEERSAGISQLSLPVTVEAKGARPLIDLAKRASAVAASLTPGVTLDVVSYVILEYLVARSVRGALRKLDPELT